VRKLFWIFFVAALLEGGFLIYHFATYEHAAIPADIDTRSAYAESLQVYKGRLHELQTSADFTREKLNRVGKSTWPAVHDRLELVDAEIQHLRTVTEHWERATADASLDSVYHEALSVYGRAAGLVLSATYDTLLEPEGKAAEKKQQ
jgi:hypothetical protein